MQDPEVGDIGPKIGYNNQDGGPSFDLSWGGRVDLLNQLDLSSRRRFRPVSKGTFPSRAHLGDGGAWFRVGTLLPGVLPGRGSARAGSAEDNGFCRFERVRIPRTHMAMRQTTLHPDGRYEATEGRRTAARRGGGRDVGAEKVGWEGGSGLLGEKKAFLATFQDLEEGALSLAVGFRGGRIQKGT